MASLSRSTIDQNGHINRNCCVIHQRQDFETNPSVTTCLPPVCCPSTSPCAGRTGTHRRTSSAVLVLSSFFFIRETYQHVTCSPSRLHSTRLLVSDERQLWGFSYFGRHSCHSSLYSMDRSSSFLTRILADGRRRTGFARLGPRTSIGVPIQCQQR